MPKVLFSDKNHHLLDNNNNDTVIYGISAVKIKKESEGGVKY